MLSLWDQETLKAYTVPTKKPLAFFLKENTARYGVSNSDTVGLITTVLGGNIPDETINILIRKTIRELSQMTGEEFAALPGIGKSKAIRLTAVFELSRRLSTQISAEKPIVKTPDDAAALVMDEMRHLDREHFRVLLLNTKNSVIEIDKVSVGTLNESLIHPREVFRNAIKKGAKSIILVHNHPSGDPTPSTNDIEITKKLFEAGKIISIEVLDHIIIGDGRFVSLKAKGVI
jgi:DNA repair protein RadC